uniref:Uncharacterized protein n=1 Tax=Oryza meridionalis TaxID=40149 RepID=A0A0E0F2M7_9ORYZ
MGPAGLGGWALAASGGTPGAREAAGRVVDGRTRDREGAARGGEPETRSRGEDPAARAPRLGARGWREPGGRRTDGRSGGACRGLTGRRGRARDFQIGVSWKRFLPIKRAWYAEPEEYVPVGLPISMRKCSYIYPGFRISYAPPLDEVTHGLL